jgi:hypothetical protein
MCAQNEDGRFREHFIHNGIVRLSRKRHVDPNGGSLKANHAAKRVFGVRWHIGRILLDLGFYKAWQAPTLDPAYVGSMPPVKGIEEEEYKKQRSIAARPGGAAVVPKPAISRRISRQSRSVLWLVQLLWAWLPVRVSNSPEIELFAHADCPNSFRGWLRGNGCNAPEFRFLSHSHRHGASSNSE